MVSRVIRKAVQKGWLVVFRVFSTKHAEPFGDVISHRRFSKDFNCGPQRFGVLEQHVGNS